MASVAYSPAYAPRRHRPNAIVPDIEALLDAQKRSDSSLSQHEDGGDDAPTSLRPPPRGPKKNRPLRLDGPAVTAGGVSANSASSSAASSPAFGISSSPASSSLPRSPPVQSTDPIPSPPLRPLPKPPSLTPPSVLPSFSGRSLAPSPDHTQVLVAHTRTHSITVTPPEISAGSLLSDWSLPPSSPLSPFAPRVDSPIPEEPSLPTSTPMSSLSKVEQLLGREAIRTASPQPLDNKERRRPPALRHSPEPSEEGGISVSSTRYPSSDRDSFIDLDDPNSPENRHFASTRSSFLSEYSVNVQHAMYPTPTRMTFREGNPEPGTARSDSSRLPDFAPSAPYQPPSPRRARPPSPHFPARQLSPPPVSHRRPRPVSMLVTPTPTAAFFSDPRPAPKPPLPRAPKPTQLLRKAAAQAPQQPYPPPPPMTNELAPGERAEILRKHRKIAQVLGEGVGGMLWPTDDPHAHAPRHNHRKGAHSADMRQEGQVLEIGPARRHSSPTSAGFGGGDYAAMVHVAEGGSPRAQSRLTVDSQRTGSPESFIELSDEEDAHEHEHEEPALPSPSEERKKKRDRLAKLHRFLGSRVPVELALGAPYALHEEGLPPLPVQPASDGEITPRTPRDHEKDKGWMRRRRSSSTAALPGYNFGAMAMEERLKDELGEKERVLNVKRGQKMEQMFGTRPPAKLYQTRQYTVSSPSSPISPSRWPQPPQNLPRNSNLNSSAYRGKGRHKRPGTSDSGDALLSHDALANEGMSAVYMYYRHSLNSLTDIVNKDDRASLAELHQYINASGSSEDDTDVPAALPTSPAERRRSLPARTSVQSIASTITLTPPNPNPTGFQARRRRAAKLTNFFGVNYRDLFGDVLESIENGVREEVEVGTLKAHEVEELMGKLRKLKTRRDEILG